MLKRIEAYVRINKMLKRNRKMIKRFKNMKWSYIVLAGTNAERNWRSIQKKVLFDTELAEYVLTKIDELDKQYFDIVAKYNK